ncbi:MAG TPA: efflux transporter outer membrane subunit [Thermoanaerobaculia bacterium]|nr:efflux transporter outer membrane subunit [Thermoanaerobaculia bacterium]HQR65976.1 efflux transporter outer membrane subunit [Thermoanaerobaculia bacterium]
MKRLAVLSAALLLAGGCAVGPDYKRPDVAVPESYREVQGPPAPAPSLANQPWWEIFKDDQLNGLIDEALRNNYDAKIAAARVEEFRARSGIAKSEFFPQIGYAGGVSRGLTSTYVNPGATTGNQVAANVNFGWELDLWGRVRRLNEAAKAQYLASEEVRRGVLLSLVSDVAQTYFRLLDLDRELVIMKETVASFRETYDLFNRKLEGGAASAVQTAYAAAAMEQAAAQVPETERLIEATENQLAALLGRNPGPIPRGKPLDGQFDPPAVPAGLPADLLRQRPDIQAAEQDMVAANAQVGVAVASFFPTISLTGVFGGVSPDVSNLFGAGKAWSIAAGLVGPLFQGGKLRSQYEVAVAQWEQAKLRYEQTVTNAFAEATTVLYARQKLLDSEAALRRTADQYAEMVRLQNIRYNAGLASYFEVLYAMQQLYPAELTLTRARLQLLNDYVDIYKALGGGWNQPELPPPPGQPAPAPPPPAK